MRRIEGLRKQLTFANVVSVVALFIALGGASYAAINLPKNSVGTKQLKGKSVGTKQLKGKAVSAKKLKAGAVNSAKVRDGSLRATDFREGELLAGPTGPSGATGPTGATGPDGLLRVAGVTVASPDETETVIASTAITAPADGHLMIVASVDSGSIGATTDGFDCLIKLDDDPTEHGLRSVRVTGPGNDEENCATNALVPVEAGPHTVRFEGNSVNAAAVRFSSADMQVLFVPSDGTGS